MMILLEIFILKILIVCFNFLLLCEIKMLFLLNFIMWCLSILNDGLVIILLLIVIKLCLIKLLNCECVMFL